MSEAQKPTAEQKSYGEAIYNLASKSNVSYQQHCGRVAAMTAAQKYAFRDFDVVVDSTKFIVQCKRPHDGTEWELRTIRVQGAQVNSDSVDIADFLANNANDIYCKIEDDALAQCAAYDHDAPVEAALDVMKDG